MAFWDRVRDNIGWDRGPAHEGDRDRDRWTDRGGWSGRDRDYDRPYDRGYGTDYGRGDHGRRDYSSGPIDRHYGDRNYGYGSRHFNDDSNRDRWSSGRMQQGSYDDYNRYDRDRDRSYRGSAGGADFDRGSYGYDFGERHSSGRFSGGTMGRGNYDRTDFDFDRDRWRDERHRDEWDRNRNRW